MTSVQRSMPQRLPVASQCVRRDNTHSSAQFKIQIIQMCSLLRVQKEAELMKKVAPTFSKHTHHNPYVHMTVSLLALTVAILRFCQVAGIRLLSVHLRFFSSGSSEE